MNSAATLTRLALLGITLLAAAAPACADPPPGDVAAKDPKGDAAAILGHWLVVDSKVNGKPVPEEVGEVYTFKDHGEFDVFANDYEAIFIYRLDVKASPKQLVYYFSNPKFAGSGIYRLEGNRLTWRTSDDEQQLSFTANPKGDWAEQTFRRITDDERKKAVEKIKAQRLRSR